MGQAIDTIMGIATNPSTTPTALTMASGDSLTVRSFAQPDTAKLEQMLRRGATAGLFRVRSPLLIDNVTGLALRTSETPSQLLLPREVGQPLQSGDTLIAELTGGSSEVDLGALVVYYSNLPGAAPRLYMWSDISALIKNIKGMEVDVTSSGTAGVWGDTVFTTTENLLPADTDFAVLGYTLDTALAVVAVKGTDTSNLRIGGPGAVASGLTSHFFVDQSNYHGTPHIPVFNSNNRSGMFVSVADSGTSTASKVTLVLAELSQNLA